MYTHTLVYLPIGLKPISHLGLSSSAVGFSSAPQSPDLCERAACDLLRDSTGRSLSASHILVQFLNDLVI